MHERGRALRVLAARQFGHVTRRQLLMLGFSASAIDRRVRAGELIRVYAGVYAVGHRPRDPVARMAAAVLACGEGAVLSHASAACLWGLAKAWPTLPEVTVVADRRPSGIWVHHTRRLARADIRRHLGIRVTSPARTVLDIAPRLTDSALNRVVNDGRRSGHLQRPQLLAVSDRLGNHPGARRVRGLALDSDRAPTRSEFEDAFLSFCEQFGLPRPVVNVRLAGHEADAVFFAERLIVELDGYDFHRDREAFEGDRDRDVEALLLEFATVRVTWDRLIGAPEREARRLHAILHMRRAT